MCQHAVCVYRQYSMVCVSMQCVCTDSTVQYVSMQCVCTDSMIRYVSMHCVCTDSTVQYSMSACIVFQKALLVPSVNNQPQCLSTKFWSHLYCRVRLNNPAHHHMCCDVSTQPLFTSHSAVYLLALWLAMATAATCDNKIFHN